MNMRDRMGAVVLALLAVFTALGAAPAALAADPPAMVATQTDYRIHAGDLLLVGVYDDPKMPPINVTVTPDGKFSFPLIGILVAGGKTPEQLRVEMETKLRKFVSEPVVTCSIVEVKGNVAYVIGQVAKPGAIVMNPAVNVLQALSIAGGGNAYAKLDSVIVIRNAVGGQRTLNFHYSQVSNGKNLEQNVQLESGDVVVVP
ncbi:MAG TPA: polysaccharide biosynthesis/export family protein [Steroidobacteraceae bacterium]|nr:polysaccharide biosynthesis/export family protein [Steroidobacteraceae bacterium]